MSGCSVMELSPNTPVQKKRAGLATDWHHNQCSSALNRRNLLKLGVATVVAASLPGRQLLAQSVPETCAPPIPQNHAPSNGGPCPYPIPWLDKNGNHNQSP